MTEQQPGLTKAQLIEALYTAKSNCFCGTCGQGLCKAIEFARQLADPSSAPCDPRIERIRQALTTADGWEDGETFYKNTLERIEEILTEPVAPCRGDAPEPAPQGEREVYDCPTETVYAFAPGLANTRLPLTHLTFESPDGKQKATFSLSAYRAALHPVAPAGAAGEREGLPSDEKLLDLMREAYIHPSREPGFTGARLAMLNALRPYIRASQSQAKPELPSDVVEKGQIMLDALRTIASLRKQYGEEINTVWECADIAMKAIETLSLNGKKG